MKRLLCALMVLLSVALPQRNGWAQWVQTNGPYGATVNCIDTLGGNIFIGTDGGVFESTDQGTNWQKRSSGLPNTYIYSLATRGSNLFAGTVWKGIYRSTDSGATWNSASFGLPNYYTADALGSNSDALFSPDGSQTYMSSNDGNTWTLVDTNLTALSNPQVVLTIDSATYFAGGWITRTTDNGLHWDVIAIPPADSFWQAFSLVNLGDVLFAEIWEEASAGSQEEILRSTNDGETWENICPDFLNGPLTTLAVMGKEVFAGTDNGLVYRSIDSGQSWQLASSGLPSGAEVGNLASIGTELLAGSYGLGMYRSFDSGATWSECNQGLLNTGISAISGTGDTTFVSTDAGVFLGTNDGSFWQPKRNGLKYYYDLNSIYIDSERLFAGLYLSTDRGESWNLPDSSWGNQDIETMIRSGHILLAGGTAGVFESTNDGNSWNNANRGDTTASVWIFGIVKIGSTLVFATNQQPYISTNGGITWQEASQGIQDSQQVVVWAVGTAGSKVFIQCTSSGSNLGIFVSDDTGSTWHQAVGTLFPFRGRATNFTSVGDNLFAATDSMGIFLTTDYGAHWTSENLGLGDSSILSLAVQGDELLAGTANSGVWRRPLAEMIPPSSVASAAPASDTLSVFPNPASQLLHIMPGPAGAVRLFDLLGRIRAETYNDGSGASLDVSNVEPGTYFLRMGSRSATVEIMH